MKLDVDTISDLLGIARTQLVRWGIKGELCEVHLAGGVTRRRLFPLCPLIQFIAKLPTLPAGVCRAAGEYLTETGVARRDRRDNVIFDATTAEGQAAVRGWLAGLLCGLESLDDNFLRNRFAENECGMSIEVPEDAPADAPESDS